MDTHLRIEGLDDLAWGQCNGHVERASHPQEQREEDAHGQASHCPRTYPHAPTYHRKESLVSQILGNDPSCLLIPTDYNQGVEYPTEGEFNADSFILRLRHALTGPLPGVEAQLAMAPLGHTPPVLPRNDVRQSAVLALLHRRAGYKRFPEALSLLFTLRPNSLRHHPGQISFPGGGAEPPDDSLAATALRETSEELGIPTGTVRILGELTPLYIAPSRILVHPFVGWLPELPTLTPDPVEVSEILEVPLNHLLDPGQTGTHIWYRDGTSHTAPCFLVPAPVGETREGEEMQVHIWGATAMILNELLEVIRLLVPQTL